MFGKIFHMLFFSTVFSWLPLEINKKLYYYVKISVKWEE